jgi:hypothetical protein
MAAAIDGTSALVIRIQSNQPRILKVTANGASAPTVAFDTSITAGSDAYAPTISKFGSTNYYLATYHTYTQINLVVIRLNASSITVMRTVQVPMSYGGTSTRYVGSMGVSGVRAIIVAADRTASFIAKQYDLQASLLPIQSGMPIGLAANSAGSGGPIRASAGLLVRGDKTNYEVGKDYFVDPNDGKLTTTALSDSYVGRATSPFALMLNDGAYMKVKMQVIARLVSRKETPSYEVAKIFDFWKTREIKTTTGTFVVPAGVYMLGIAAVGKGGDSSYSSYGPQAGGGGGVAYKVINVYPGQSIAYTIASNIATCGGMTGNPASGATGGTASGGHFNYSGNTVAGVNLGAGAAGGGGTTKSSGGGGCGMTHWGLTANTGATSGYGGGGVGGMVQGRETGVVDTSGGGGCLGVSGWGGVSGAIGELPAQMGIFVTSDVDTAVRWRSVMFSDTNPVTSPRDAALIPFCGGGGGNYGGNGGIGAGGGGHSSGTYSTDYYNGGLGGGGGAIYGTSYPAAGGGIGPTTNAGTTPAFGGGAGYYNTPVAGGAACVVFLY